MYHNIFFLFSSAANGQIFLILIKLILYSLLKSIVLGFSASASA